MPGQPQRLALPPAPATSGYGKLSLSDGLPPLFVCLLMSTLWSTYTGLHLLPLLQLGWNDGLRDAGAARSGWFQLFASHTLFSMTLLCYALSLLTPPGKVPDDRWKWEARQIEIALPPTHELKKVTGARRHCKWCFKYKPDRCHHCRMCQSCVLKMDHHCPWIMNCVGFRNHKYFFLLVVYSLLSCAFIACTAFWSVLRSVQEDMPFANRFLLVFCVVVSTIMTIMLSAFGSFHSWLMLRGLTTIEFCEKGLGIADSVPSYDRGTFQNVVAALGPQPLLWLLPLCLPLGDGTNFGRPKGESNEQAGADPEWTVS
mmetsp:Transcript_56695/g.122033  ORF Transcript_56695/g.122033 Transcript_56695/m.122033 type:complete len:314 (-) Transcript_56695:88-1029(-)